jgi:cytochrome c556
MRLVFVVTAAALGTMLYTGLASAQQNNPIEERQKLMKANGREAALMAKMVKGEVPYDSAKVNAAFTQWETTAKNVGSLFPDDSKVGHDTRALPKIWTDKAEFSRARTQ